MVSVDTTGDEQQQLTFSGMHITDNEGMLHIDQDFYISKIEQTPNGVELGKFASMRMRLAWIKSTRPDLVFEISQIAQVTRDIFHQYVTKHCKRLDKESNMLIVTMHRYVFPNKIQTHSELSHIAMLLSQIMHTYPNNWEASSFSPKQPVKQYRYHTSYKSQDVSPAPCYPQKSMHMSIYPMSHLPFVSNSNLY